MRSTGRLRAFEITFDNDRLATWPHQDRWYTSGLMLHWVSEPDEQGPQARLARRACAWIGCGPDARLYRLDALEHQIHPPTDTRRTDPQPSDRPYAGWLALGTGLLAREPDTLHRLDARIGVLGPAALGEPDTMTLRSVEFDSDGLGEQPPHRFSRLLLRWAPP